MLKLMATARMTAGCKVIADERRPWKFAEMIGSNLLVPADCAALLFLSSQAFIPTSVTKEELAEAVQELIQRTHLARLSNTILFLSST